MRRESINYIFGNIIIILDRKFLNEEQFSLSPSLSLSFNWRRLNKLLSFHNIRTFFQS